MMFGASSGGDDLTLQDFEKFFTGFKIKKFCFVVQLAVRFSKKNIAVIQKWIIILLNIGV